MAGAVEDKKNKGKLPDSSAGVIILQWLTYAFWGWTLLSLVCLVFIVMASFLTSQDMSEGIPYAIAATLVLLPLSAVCDIFYGRHEPAKKTGAAMVVMVIHAVIFALFGIGLLISAVLTLLQMLIGTSSDTEFQQVWVWTALISTCLYAFTFLRTLNPTSRLRLPVIFPTGMAVVVGLFIVLGFVGPVAKASLTRTDRDIASSLDDVTHAVSQYVSANKQLPARLSDASLTGKAKEIVAKGLVSYKSEGAMPRQSTKPDNGPQTMEYQLKEYRYQLCVDYRESDQRSSDYYENNMGDGYNTYVSTYGHPAGKVCYKLKVEQ